jgi:hypothetical protein
VAECLIHLLQARFRPFRWDTTDCSQQAALLPKGCCRGAEIYQFHGTGGPDVASFSGSKWLSKLVCMLQSGLSVYLQRERKMTSCKCFGFMLHGSIKIHIVHFFSPVLKSQIPSRREFPLRSISGFWIFLRIRQMSSCLFWFSAAQMVWYADWWFSNQYIGTWEYL